MNKKTLGFKALKKAIKKNGADEFFRSPIFRNVLERTANAVSKRLKIEKISLELGWDLKEKDIAYTDNQVIHINMCNDLVKEAVAKNMSIEDIYLLYFGLLGHECGHLLFSDFDALRKILENLMKGVNYITPPKFNEKLEKAYQDLEKFVFSDKASCSVYTNIFSTVSNILEDKYVNERMREYFPGTFKTGINKTYELMMPEEKEYTDIAKSINFMKYVHQYLESGKMKFAQRDFSEFSDPEFIGFLDSIEHTHSPKDRFKATYTVLAYAAEYLLEDFKDTRNKLGENLQNMDNSSHSNSSGSGALNPNQDYSNDDSDSEDGSSQSSQSSEYGKENNSSSSSENGKNDSKDEKDGQNKASSGNNEDGDKKDSSKSKDSDGKAGEKDKKSDNGKDTDNDKGTNKDNQSKSDNLNSKCDGDSIDRSKDPTANDACRKRASESKEIKPTPLSDILERYAETMIKNDPNKAKSIIARENTPGKTPNGVNSRGIDFEIPPLGSCQKNTYNTLYSELKVYSDRLKRGLQDIIDDKREGISMRNLLSGNRVNPASSASSHGKIFKRNKMPDEEPELAVSILIDGSGSMSGTRQRMAQKAAILIAEFCFSLYIPVAIASHDSGYSNNITIYPALDFDDNVSDKYRLANSYAGGCNRDGLALRWAINGLSQRPEDRKIMIIISDGYPSDYNSYQEASLDIAECVKRCKRENILLVAAAIGDDKKNIQKLYGDAFLDISDLSMLPKKLINQIKKYVL